MDKSSFSIKEANFIDSNSILFIRVKVNDLSKAVEYILKVFKDESWLKNIEEDYLRESIEACTSDTVKELEKNLHHTNGDDVSKEVGEYVVSFIWTFFVCTIKLNLQLEKLISIYQHSSIILFMFWQEPGQAASHGFI